MNFNFNLNLLFPVKNEKFAYKRTYLTPSQVSSSRQITKMPPTICNARKGDGTRCTFKAKYFNDMLCGVHENQRFALGDRWTMPVWNVHAHADEHEHADPPPVDHVVTDCTLCGRHLSRRSLAMNARFCPRCEITRDREDLPAEQRCQWNVGHPRRHVCLRVRGVGHTLCVAHNKSETKLRFNHDYARAHREIENAGEQWENVVAEIETNIVAWPEFGPAPSWARNTVIARIAQDMRIPVLFNRLAERLGRVWRMDDNGDMFMPRQRNHVDPNRPPLGDLEAFATDVQNVHTRSANETTNKGLGILLKEPVKDPIDIHMMIALTIPLSTSVQTEKIVVLDVLKWYSTTTCRVRGDLLYKRTLDALWVRIEASKHREELVKRLWEEWVESTGKCCDGHIARLINVLVGFDPEFLPPVPVGELLQQRMAALSVLDIETEEKVMRAKAIFDELGTPEDQRGAWIEAF